MKRKFYLPASLLLALLCSTLSCLWAQSDQRMTEQIKKLLDEKNRRTAVEKKVSSQLLQAIREKNGQKMTDGVELEPANVEADANGYLLIDIRATVSDSLLQAIKNAGGSIQSSFPKYDAIRARIHLSKVLAVAAFPQVISVRPAAKAFAIGNGSPAKGSTHRIGYDKPTSTVVKKKSLAIRQRRPLKDRLERVKKQLEKYLQEQDNNLVLGTGDVNSQGDHAHRADSVRTAYGVQGQGIRIGVLSDSYNAQGGALSDVYTGNLPGTGNPLGYTTPVTVVEDYAGQSDEGRAMLQIVHDLAPKAQLFFATAYTSEAGFASNITALRNTYDCDIIIDDIFYYDEPQFQDGIIAQAVATVTAAGVLYFSSAGNEGNVRKNTAGVFEGDFNDAGSLAFAGTAAAGTVHNFGTATAPVNGDIITAAGNLYTLIWSDSYYNATNDYDLFLVSSTGTVKSSSTDIQDGVGGDYAFEAVNVPTLVAGDRLVVFKKASAAVRAFCINTFRGRLTNFTGGQTHGHSAIVAAYSVAATPAATSFSTTTPNGPFPGVFTSTNQVENFTSDGLRRMFTNPDGTQITPGNVLFATNGGTVRNKPDITAADGVATTLATTSGLNPFYGTSAAAPHAGAIAALIKSARPSITPAQMRTLLTSTALDIETTGYDNVSGFGIVQTAQAMQSLAPTLRADVSLVSYTPVEDNQNNGNGAPDPGEAIRLLVNLKNTSQVTASGVSAALTSNTDNIGISTPACIFGNIAPGATKNNSGAPFTFVIGNNVPCGTEINFVLNVSFTGGLSPQSIPLIVRVGGQPASSLTANLGTPVASTTFYTSSTGTQTGRIARTGVVSSCSAAKTAPGLTTTVGARRYDAYRFMNTSTNAQCVTSTLMSTNGVLLYAVAYNNNGFVPTNPNANFLADQGLSGNGQSFSFNVPAGQAFTVVVHDINAASTATYNYNLNVSLSTCSPVILPVTWLGFTAVEKGGQTALQWKVADEINADHYEIEYSTDGSQFTKLYTLPATTRFAATKTYDQLHPFPVAGTNYYRIRQVDKDGRYSYSKTELVRIAKANSIVVAPNPATSFVKVQAKTTITQIRLYNAAGQLVLSSNPAALSTTLMVNQLPAGQYSMVIETKDETIRKSIIKE